MKILVVGLLSGLFALPVNASLITTFYADNDSFAVGAGSAIMDTEVSNQDAGEAPITYTGLIADSLFAAGRFNPTGLFELFSVDELNTSAIHTLSLRAFGLVDSINAANRFSGLDY